jgi:5-methylcytosine-specific restriction endonuclease McrA
MSEEPDKLPELLDEAVRGLVAGDAARAEAAMKQVYRRPISRRRPRGPGPREQLSTYRRDHFHCRYCDRKTISYPVFELLGPGFFPAELPFHANWRADLTHPAIPVWSSSVDHVHAVSTGGHPVDPRNLVTACSACQYQKGNAAGRMLRPIIESQRSCAVPLRLRQLKAR